MALIGEGVGVASDHGGVLVRLLVLSRVQWLFETREKHPTSVQID